ncbi:MAG: hypothetical protein COA57_03640 [Flavobacteriales bacterium]|nr:MAG: hypothetical protein COA57_03640 [Flavobacteriales bacterium]
MRILLILICVLSCFSCSINQNIYYDYKLFSINQKFNLDYIPISIQLPGRWVFDKQNKATLFFKNKITGRHFVFNGGEKTKYEFYSDSLTNDSLYLEAYYKWDSDYLLKQLRGTKSVIIERGLSNGKYQYLIWKLEGKEGYFMYLTGIKEIYAFNIMHNIGGELTISKKHILEFFEHITINR